METEQMAAVAASRGGYTQGRPPRGRNTGITMTHEAKVETPHPIPARTLRALVDSVPEDAEFEVTAKEGGHQLDRQVVGYRITARWSTT